MRRTAAAAILLGMMTLPVKAIEGPDGNRYPGWHNRMTGYQAVKEPRWHVKRQRVVRQHARRKPVRVTRARPLQAHKPASPGAKLIAAGVTAAMTPLAQIAGRYLGGNPTGWRSRWCGNFMRLVVKQAGLPDHPGGNLARNWVRYGRPSGPVNGAIGVLRSHVGIVIGRCPDGRIRLRSGNHSRRVGDGCYAAHRFIAYRSVG